MLVGLIESPEQYEHCASLHIVYAMNGMHITETLIGGVLS
jgi:hypothetical protein